MERERERKRKKTEKGKEADNDIGADDRMRRKGRAVVVDLEKEVSVGMAPPPTEEEVEEFFTILRRMRVAAKYFEKGGASNNKSGIDRQLDTTALESTADTVKVDGKRVANGGFDLNSVPETESNLV